MDSKATHMEMLFEKAQEYGKTTIELFKLNAVDKSADVVSSLVSRLAILMVVALLIIILSIGLALWTGELLGKSYYGFFLIGGLYLILTILLNIFRHQWLKKPVSNSIIGQMLKEKSL